jgi:hypothetical protein
LQSNFFLTADGNIGPGLWILSMTVIAIFAYRRGWQETPYWLRQYIWCAAVLEALVWLPLITLRFITKTTDFSSYGRSFEFFGFIYLLVIFLGTILVWLGVAIGAVLMVGMLVGMFVPTKT